MFFKKREQEWENCIQDLKQKLLDEMARGQEQQHQLAQRQLQLVQESDRKLEQLGARVSKHDMALEDLLEEWEEKSAGEERLLDSLQEQKQAEKKLLDLFEAYLDQFFDMRRMAHGQGGGWAGQLELMEKQLEHYRRLCGITVISDCGVPVDYDLHEVIEPVATGDRALDQTVEQVYRCGYFYQGTVKRKAQVTAYRFQS